MTDAGVLVLSAFGVAFAALGAVYKLATGEVVPRLADGLREAGHIRRLARGGVVVGLALLVDGVTSGLVPARFEPVRSGALVLSLTVALYAHVELFAAANGYRALGLSFERESTTVAKLERLEARGTAWLYYVDRNHGPVTWAFLSIAILLPLTLVLFTLGPGPPATIGLLPIDGREALVGFVIAWIVYVGVLAVATVPVRERHVPDDVREYVLEACESG